MIFQNPVRGTISATSSASGFRMTQDFGPTPLGAEPTVIWPGGEGIPAGRYKNFHKGIDLGNKRCGAVVLAPASGTVHISMKTSAGENIIVIRHGSGWFSGYGHLAKRTVAKGDRVAVGAKIGEVGSTGNSTACHLHWFVKSDADPAKNIYSDSNGKWRNPWPLLMQNVTIRPIEADGIRIRNAATTDGLAFAETKAGRLVRLADDVDLGPALERRKWGGGLTGGSYVIDGVAGNAWDRIWFDGAFRFIASPLAVRSAY